MFYLIPISSVIYCKTFSCFSVYSCFNIWELLSSPSLISKWSLGQSKMRPDWHTGREGKGRDCGGRRANAGTALWLRALLCSTCRVWLVQDLKNLEKVAISWPRPDPRRAEAIRMHQWAEVWLRSGWTKGEGWQLNKSNCWAAARDRDTFPGWFTLAGSR